MYISPVESCFFHILSIYWLKFTSQQIPILSSEYPFFCFVEENALSIAKNISQTKHRSRRIFPIASFPLCLSHTFITHIVTDIFIIYYSFLFYYAIFMGVGISRTETVEINFSQYSPAYKKKSEAWRPNFYY